MKATPAKFLRIVFVWLAIAVTLPRAKAQDEVDLFDFEHSLSFAKFLETQKRYDLAIDEYRRIDAMSPGHLDVRMALLQLCSVSNRPIEGIVAYEKWDYHPLLVPGELRRKYIGLHLQTRDFSRLKARLQDGIGLKEPEKTRVDLHLALYLGEWKRAKVLFEAFEIQHVHASRIAFEPIITKFDNHYYRQPWLGSVLSIVPGGGQVYSGQWANGLASLFLVGVTGFEAYRLFHKRGFGNVLAWGLASVSCSFYVANIYGGQRSVKRYNEKQDAKLRQELDGVAVRYF